jgi:hypothetical protein
MGRGEREREIETRNKIGKKDIRAHECSKNACMFLKCMYIPRACAQS